MLNEQERAEREAVLVRMTVLEIQLRSLTHLYHVVHHKPGEDHWQKCQLSPCIQSLNAVRLPPTHVSPDEHTPRSAGPTPDPFVEPFFTDGSDVE